MNTKLEYVWLDGFAPEPNLRSKTKIWEFDPLTSPALQSKREMGEHGLILPCVEELPLWSFDGSSTKQADGSKSDCILKPVRIIIDPQRNHAFLVLCEVLNTDGTPHESNSRHLLPEKDNFWFGFEQEYVLEQNGRPLGFPTNGYPKPQGEFYCGVGNENVSGRDLIEEHLEVCLEAGLTMTGINAEVMIGQWEYQCFGVGSRRSSDDLWLSRFFLYRMSEKYGITINLHPKPVSGDWNGSGMHCNFSNEYMRDNANHDTIIDVCESLRKSHEVDIKNYGSDNDKRLTGLHETQSIDKFSYGVSDRGASIRIPIPTDKNGKGYLEDRRPSSNADPYKITKCIVDAVTPITN